MTKVHGKTRWHLKITSYVYLDIFYGQKEKKKKKNVKCCIKIYAIKTRKVLDPSYS